MHSAICTLYEGHYHYGVAALVNSLYANDYRGAIYIGYRGDLPPWVLKSQKTQSVENREEITIFHAAQDLQLTFIPVDTNTHFTNYKPYFMDWVWNNCVDQECLGLFYFDPDIVNNCPWPFYEKWITYGVAMIHEIVWNDMPHNHPKRMQWLEALNKTKIEVNHQLNSYLNAGFVGLSKNNRNFLNLWMQLMDDCESMGLFDKTKFSQSDNDHGLFKVGDQDLFNVTAMCTPCPISEFGPEGMDFTGGGWLMSHATGSPKPWKTNYLSSWLKGKKPTRPTLHYWSNANGIIKPYENSKINSKSYAQKTVALLSRFYSK